MSILEPRDSARSTALPRGEENVGAPAESVKRSPTRRATTQSPPVARPRRPEWTTRRWRLQVEAEARSRLKKTIRGLGAGR
jgi:hypothetical protein